eukprot:753972-Hanusia_phi.AAC.11
MARTASRGDIAPGTSPPRGLQLIRPLDMATREVCEVRKMPQVGEAAAKREARRLRGPALQENWQVEFSVHKMSAAMMEDARLTFQHELDEEMGKLGIDTQGRKAFLVENLVALPT